MASTNLLFDFNAEKAIIVVGGFGKSQLIKTISALFANPHRVDMITGISKAHTQKPWPAIVSKNPDVLIFTEINNLDKLCKTLAFAKVNGFEGKPIIIEITNKFGGDDSHQLFDSPFGRAMNIIDLDQIALLTVTKNLGYDKQVNAFLENSYTFPLNRLKNQNAG